MVYVTGDTHGDFSRFKSPEAKKIKKNDILIILGDFGFIWNNKKKEERILKKINKLRYTVAFLDGAHENFDLLEKYPKTKWNGGSVSQIDEHIYHLHRGEIYTIEDETFFVFGGGQSVDKDIRVDINIQKGQNKNAKQKFWWEQEMPTEQEMQHGRENLINHQNKVNYILTHEPTERHGGYINTRKEANGMNIFLTSVETVAEYGMWFFGSMHMDKQISSRHKAVFTDIIPVKGQRFKK